MERRRLTLGQAARSVGVTTEEVRRAIIHEELEGCVSENTGMFMIDARSLKNYQKAHNQANCNQECRRALVIDDEINFGNLVKLNLQLDKRVVAKFATWGDDGARLAMQFKPHVVLLGCMFPDSTSEAVLEQIAELRNDQGTKVIAYSAHDGQLIRDDPQLSRRLEMLGADCFIHKAVGLKKLVRRAKDMLCLDFELPVQSGCLAR